MTLYQEVLAVLYRKTLTLMDGQDMRALADELMPIIQGHTGEAVEKSLTAQREAIAKAIEGLPLDDGGTVDDGGNYAYTGEDLRDRAVDVVRDFGKESS